MNIHHISFPRPLQPITANLWLITTEILSLCLRVWKSIINTTGSNSRCQQVKLRGFGGESTLGLSSFGRLPVVLNVGPHLSSLCLLVISPPPVLVVFSTFFLCLCEISLFLSLIETHMIPFSVHLGSLERCPPYWFPRAAMTKYNNN